MKKAFISILLIVGVVSMAFAAGSATSVTQSGNNFSSGIVKTISSSTKYDSLKGTLKNVSLLKNFIPNGAGMYVLAMDTCSVVSGGALANATAILRLTARDSKNGSIIGQLNLDSLKSGAAANLPHQWVIPFGEKLVGAVFDVDLIGTATDSFYVNRVYLIKTVNETVGQGIFGR